MLLLLLLLGVCLFTLPLLHRRLLLFLFVFFVLTASSFFLCLLFLLVSYYRPLSDGVCRSRSRVFRLRQRYLDQQANRLIDLFMEAGYVVAGFGVLAR